MTGQFNYKNPIEDTLALNAGAVPPFVTVIVTNYNYSAYIVACLRSIASQTYPHYKCIIVDDSSTDDSVDVIERFIAYAESNGRFSIVRRDKNGGQMAAFKTGLEHAEGPFIVFIDADDMLLEGFLASHIKAHMGKKAVAFTSSNQYQINEKNEMLAGIHPDLQVERGLRYIEPRSLLEPFWLWATTSSMMFRRAIIEAIVPDETEQFRVCADNYICHFANLIGGSLLISEVHGCYRRHGKNCFSCNPFVGGVLPTGDMSKHPRHNMIRTKILSHILNNHEKFSSLLAEVNFLLTLIRLAGSFEIFGLKKRHQAFFDQCSSHFVRRFFVLSLMIRIEKLCNRYLGVLRDVCCKNKRSNPFL